MIVGLARVWVGIGPADARRGGSPTPIILTGRNRSLSLVERIVAFCRTATLHLLKLSSSNRRSLGAAPSLTSLLPSKAFRQICHPSLFTRDFSKMIAGNLVVRDFHLSQTSNSTASSCRRATWSSISRKSFSRSLPDQVMNASETSRDSLSIRARSALTLRCLELRA